MSWVAVAAAGASIVGGVISSSANSSAAKKSASAQLQGAQLQANSIDKQIAAIKEGVAKAQGQYQQIQAETQPGVSYLRGVMSGSAQLTPEQLQAREDMIRNLQNSSQVAGSALRGSGRSFVDAERQVYGDFTNKALAENRARADAAAKNLSDPYFNAAGNAAAIQGTSGQQVGAALANQGGVLSQGLTGAANTQAQAGIANANIYGNTLGNVASVIQNQLKTGSRPSAYGTWDETPIKPTSYDISSGDVAGT